MVLAMRKKQLRIISVWLRLARGNIRLIVVLCLTLAGRQVAAADAPAFSKLALTADGLRGSVQDARPTHGSFYLGARIKPIETNVKTLEIHDAPKPLVRYHRAVMGFRLFLSENWYLFFGVGLAVPGETVEAWTARMTPFTAGELQNSVVMVTEYGVAWMF